MPRVTLNWEEYHIEYIAKQQPIKLCVDERDVQILEECLVFGHWMKSPKIANLL